VLQESNLLRKNQQTAKWTGYEILGIACNWWYSFSLTDAQRGRQNPDLLEAAMFGGGLLYIIIVGLIAGWATGKIMKGAGYGVLVDILLGIAGAIIGSRILAMLGIFTTGGLIPSILVAIFGAVILVAIVRAIKKA
jgi:uncharacterized membrane protein YeaQ/YmgE (transglycosylase-associated protein family)